MRGLVENLIRIAIALIVAWAFFVEPISVETSSMAPQLVGAHGAAICPKCEQEIRWGTDLVPFDVAGVECPRCGAEQTDRLDRLPISGDRLLVNRNAFLFRAPRRWEIVALSDPELPHRQLVKRIVGLPGETISIRDGDLFSGDARIQKSLAELRTVAVPVSDVRRAPSDLRLIPWRGANDASQWETHSTQRGAAFLHPPTLTAGEYDWLVFRPIAATDAANPINDALPYNQDRLRRPYPVGDVLLTFMARFQGDGRLAIRFPTRQDVLLTIAPRDGRVEALIAGQSRRIAALGPFGARSVSIAAATCDGRLLVEIDGQGFPFALDDAAPAEAAAPLALGATGVGVEIAGLRLDRDLYYLPPDDRPVLAFQLADDEYLMLGDNASRSYDSRYWKHPGVARKSLLGRPFLVHGASRGSWTAGRAFQVPDFDRIRYIPPAAGE